MTSGAEEAVSVLLGAGNVTATLLIGRGRRLGWVLALALQAVWVPYDLATHQAGLLVITAVAVCPYLRGALGKPVGGRRA